MPTDKNQVSPSRSSICIQRRAHKRRASEHRRQFADGTFSFLSDDARPEEFKNNFVDPAREGKKISDDLRGSISDDSMQFASPSNAQGEDSVFDLASSSHVLDEAALPAGASCSPSVSRTKVFNNGTCWWAETEALLWFARQASTPPLVVTGAPNVPPTTVLAGGDELLGGDLAAGMRVNVGKWLDEDQSFGVGGRVFGVFDGDTTTSFSSDRFPVLGVPAFDVFSGLTSEFLIASDAGAFGRDTGSIDIESQLDFISTEAYGRILLAKGSDSRADLIAGYTFLRYDNATILRTTSIDGIDANGTENDTVTTTVDAYGAKNQFHGGHLGLLNEISGGCVTLSTLTKIALGNMSTTTNVFGSRVDNVPSTGITTENEGLLTGAHNTGSQTRDRFTYIPEINAKLKFNLTKRFDFSVGYTLIVLPEVGLGSDLISTVVDTSGFVGLPQTPGGVLRDQVSYIQGIDLGATLKF